jgi:hypothetical protein
MTSKCVFILVVIPSNTVALFPVEIANLLKSGYGLVSLRRDELDNTSVEKK